MGILETLKEFITTCFHTIKTMKVTLNIDFSDRGSFELVVVTANSFGYSVGPATISGIMLAKSMIKCTSYP